MCTRCNSCGWEGTENEMITVPHMDDVADEMVEVLACPMCFETDDLEED